MSRVDSAHVWEPGAKTIDIRTYQRRSAGEVDVITKQDEIAGLKTVTAPATGIGDDHRLTTRQYSRPHSEDHLVNRPTLVEVDPA